MNYLYIQGKFVPENKAFIAVKDRGFRFGDGVFETIRVEFGKPYNLDFHLSRLKKGLKALKLEAKIPANKTILEAIKKNKLKTGYTRIIISRGAKSRGYIPMGGEPTVIIETEEFKFDKPEPLKLFITKYEAHNITPCKTLNSLNYVMAMIEAQNNGADNALLIDENANVCETGSGNIFWIKDNVIYTPSIDNPIIPGSIRHKVLQKRDVIESKFDYWDLAAADEIFMTNVNFLVVPIKEIKSANHQTIKPKSNKLTFELREEIVADIKKSLA